MRTGVRRVVRTGVRSPPLSETDLPAPVRAVLEARRCGAPLVLATSGTSGTARAVVRSTESWWASFDGYAALTGVDADARLWVPGPLSATMNLFAAVHAAAAGAQVVGRPEDATHACLTPALLVRQGDRLRRGTRVVVAGAALSPTRHDAAARAGLVLAHYYGAAELSFVACGPHAEDLHAFPGAEVTVRAGEVWARSPYLADGYQGGAPGPLRRDAAGWATVGDRGELEGGRLRVAGRPDAVTTAGATVVLSEVEGALAPVAHAPFALVGVPHEVLGAVLGAVLTDPGDRDRLGSHARLHLAPAERPRLWRTTAELPETAAGKPDRAALAALFAPSGAAG